MKQKISKKQWDELDKNEKGLFFDNIDESFANLLRIYPIGIVEDVDDWEYPTIGILIEYLGDDWALELIKMYLEDGGETTWIKPSVMEIIFGTDNLLDNLWKAVIYKLRNK